MEIDKNPLDKILKEQLEHFTPDVPVHILGQLKTKFPTPQSSSIFSKALYAIKQAGILGQLFMVSVIAIPLVLLSIPSKQDEQKENPIDPKPTRKIENTLTTSNVSLEKNTAPLLKSKPVSLNKILVADINANLQKTHQVLATEAQSNVRLTTAPEVVSAVMNKIEDESKEISSVENQENNVTNQTIETSEEVNQVEQIIIPTAFSPNADGINDEFEIVMGQTQFYRIRIYSSKGQLIFESDNQNQHWKGTNQENAQVVESGGYRYVLEYQLKGQAKPSMAVGYIYLNR
jgi:gliding motility-associated-like protein